MLGQWGDRSGDDLGNLHDHDQYCPAVCDASVCDQQRLSAEDFHYSSDAGGGDFCFGDSDLCHCESGAVSVGGANTDSPTAGESNGLIAVITVINWSNIGPRYAAVMLSLLKLLFQGCRQYPGLWLSPLALVLLGGWMWSQSPTADSAATPPAIAIPSAIASSSPPVLLPPLAPQGTAGKVGAVPPGALPGASAGSASPAIASPTRLPPPPPLPARSNSTASLPKPLQPSQAAQPPKPVTAVPKAARPRKPLQALPPRSPQMAGLGVDHILQINVAIAENRSTLAIGFSQGGAVINEAGQPVRSLPAETRFTLSPSGTQLQLEGQAWPGAVWLVPQDSGLVYVGDRAYRGRVLVTSQGNGILAVNQVDLRHYLYSVVGSEVSASWPVAALKAQAVAARSYALTYYWRPAKPLYNIGDTESYQVYKGVMSEDPRVKQAVDATSGEFVSFNGGIVESMYAASDDIIADVFPGPGMSQLGALDFAQQGHSYQEILAHYYPGTSIGRLVVGQ